MENQIEALRRIRENFLSSRAVQEMNIAAWAEKIAKCDKSLLEGIELPEPLTLRTLIPELYTDKPRQEVYDKQYNDAVELLEKVNARADELIRKTEELIKEYNVMISE